MNSLINELSEALQPVFVAHSADLYKMEFVNENGMHILRIMITKRDGNVDLDLCTLISEEASAILDTKDSISSEYYLEVCSAGAERELRNDADIMQAINEYVYIKFNKAYNKLNELKGELLNFDGKNLEVAYMDKATKRKALIDKADIALIRLSVRV